MFENVGKALMISILDILGKNDYSRIPLTEYKNLDTLRKKIGNEVRQNERFL
jgi:hypothetical protein